jgi:hypothetical protein
MRVPDSKRYIIARLLERYLANPRPAGLVEVARVRDALPIYTSWTSTTFLATDGQFFTLNQEDESGEFHPELSEPWQIASLTTASRNDPALTPLLPERTSTATDCSFCGARGFLLVGEARIDVTCGECAGLGWRDPSIKQKA